MSNKRKSKRGTPLADQIAKVLLDYLPEFMRDLGVGGDAIKGGGWAADDGSFTISFYGSCQFAGEKISLVELAKRIGKHLTLRAAEDWCVGRLEEYSPVEAADLKRMRKRRGHGRGRIFNSVPTPEVEQKFRQAQSHGGDWLNADLWRRMGVKEPAKVVRVWEYRTKVGQLELLVARVEHRDRPKSFVQVAHFGLVHELGVGVNVGWERIAAEYAVREPTPLYNLPKLNEHHDWPVLVVEGEQAADAADAFIARLGLSMVAITWLGGALKTTDATGKADWAALRGRRVIVWPDNDDDGMDAADRLPPLMYEGGVTEVRRVQLPPGVFPEKWDLGKRPPEGMTDTDLHRLLDAATLVGADQRTSIELIPGELPTSHKKAEAALLAGAVKIYQRGGELVRTLRLDRPIEERSRHRKELIVRRDAGSLVINSIGEAWLRNKLQVAARFIQHDNRGNPSFVGPTKDLIESLLGLSGEWQFPELRGIVSAPTLRADYSVLEREGYDEESGLYLDFAGTVFPAIPERPTRADAERALAQLLELVAYFPFVPDDVDVFNWTPEHEEGRKASAARSVWLSAVLTGLIRPALRTAPIHAFDAPVMGSGKSFLSDVISIIVTGQPAAATSLARKPEEEEKRWLSILSRGDPVVLIDNIDHHVEGDVLCSILTQQRWSARLLGTNKIKEVSTSCLILANGNNLTFKGDMTRRAVICRIDPRVEQADSREFPFDPRTLAREQRPKLVVAALTLVRAYLIDGRPLEGKVLPPVGSFEDWDLVREVLIWRGQPDPEKTRRSISRKDPEKQSLAEVMKLWDFGFGDETIRAPEAIRRTNREAATREEEPGYDPRWGQLQAALTDVCLNGKLNARSLGRWLTDRDVKMIGGMCFVSSDDNHGQRYKLKGGRPAGKSQQGDLGLNSKPNGTGHGTNGVAPSNKTSVTDGGPMATPPSADGGERPDPKNWKEPWVK